MFQRRLMARRISTGNRRILGGFTLIELLVVIGIIALLMSILLPALQRARQEADKISCAARQRQWGTAASTYASENDNYFPYNGWQGFPERGIHSHMHGWWWNTSVVAVQFVGEYLDFTYTPSNLGEQVTETIISCPTPNWASWQEAFWMRDYQGLGYAWMPGRIGHGMELYVDAGWLEKVRFGSHYSRTPIMVDMAQQALWDPFDGWLGWNGTRAWSAHVTKNTGEPNGQNYLFEDGSVEWYNFAEVEQGSHAWGDWHMHFKIPIQGLVNQWDM